MLRMLVGDSEISNGLQLQVNEENMIQLDKKSNSNYRPNPVQSPWAAEVKEVKPPMFRLEDHASVFYDRVVPE